MSDSTNGHPPRRLTTGFKMLLVLGVALLPLGLFALFLSIEYAPSASVTLTVALPVAMWLGAALLGWLAVRQLLLRPLARLHEAVRQYGADGHAFHTPLIRTPSSEIHQLSQAFADVVTRLEQHERELEAGLTEQRRLTREVHHRVKNNLQVVASLLNLHARTATSEEKAEAFASIQRRVDALAIVQRNLFAELDSQNGISLRPVIAELASGLHQSAPAAARIAITLDTAAVHVGQDIAAPVAFLITELAELALQCSNEPALEITVGKGPAANGATLAIRSEALRSSAENAEHARYERVLSGLARQLRAELVRSEDGTLYSIAIPTLD